MSTNCGAKLHHIFLTTKFLCHFLRSRIPKSMFDRLLCCMPTTLSAALKEIEEDAQGVKALWNYSQTELDLESHSCIVSKQKSSFPSALGFIDAMPRTSGILQTTIFQMQFCSAISHAFRSGHNFRPCHFNPKRSLTPVHILGFAEQMTVLFLKAQRTT